MMPDPVTAIGTAASIGGSLIQGAASKKAAKQMAKAMQAGVKSIEATQEELRGIFDPYMGAGESALGQQLASLGLVGGPRAERQYVAGVERSPIFQALAQQGEEAMLQNAAATGGLRGGNIQGALAQFRPSLLNQFLNQRYEQLGGLTRGGLQASTSLGSGLAGTAGSIADLIAGGGVAQGRGTLAAGQAYGNALGTFGNALGGLFGGGGGGGSGRGAATDMGTIAMGGGF